MANVIKHKRGSGSDPSASDLILGELAIRTDTGKLFTKMDSGAIAEIAGGGSDIAINTLSSSSATGGGSATFNGSAYRFTLSAPPNVSAAQLLVSINGVIQKPVAGTGQPSEGFSVDGTDIILGDAPATGSDFFILTFKSLGVSEPADNSVTSAKIVDGAIVNADINASAAIQGTKISPDFGSQAISTTNDSVTIGDSIIHSGDTDTKIRFPVANQISFETQGSEAVRIDENGKVGIGHDNPSELLTVKGNAPIIRIEENQSGGNKRLDLGVTNSGSVGFIGANQSASSLAFQTTNNERMRITSTGLVGIGTSSPGYPLDVRASSGDANMRLKTDGTGSGDDTVFRLQVAGTTQDNFIYFGDADDSNAGQINYNHNGNFLRFFTNAGERMRIDSSGRLLIGTTTVGAKDAASPLQIQTADSGAFAITIKNRASNNDYSFIGFTDDDASEDLAQIGVQRTAANTGDIFFYTNGGSSGSNERMRIDSSGNVGIGTTNPGALLTLNNTIPELRVQSSNNNFGMGDALGLISLYTADGSTPGAGEVFRIKTESASSIGADYTTRLYNRNGAGGGGTEISLGNGQGSVYFSTNTTGNATASVRMVVMSDGNVGIGTTSPTGKFAVSDGTVVAEINPFSASNGVFIGTRSNHAVLFKTNAQERMRIDTSGNIGMGITPQCTTGNILNLDDEFFIGFGNGGNGRPDFQIGTTGGSTLDFRCGFGGDGVDLSINTGGLFTGDFNDTSDERLKDNIQDIADNQINIIKQLRAVTFDWKNTDKGSNTGFIAQEVIKVLPNDVTYADSSDTNSTLGINNLGITAVLTKALQEAIAKIETLETKVAALEAK